MVQRWEYLTLDAKRSDRVTVATLNALGLAGWELVLQRCDPDGYWALIFKRPLVEGSAE